MSVNTEYKSNAMTAVHEMMADLHAGGVVDKQTMRRFDEACLTPIRPLKPEEIKAIRGFAQAVIAGREEGA